MEYVSSTTIANLHDDVLADVLRSVWTLQDFLSCRMVNRQWWNTFDMALTNVDIDFHCTFVRIKLCGRMVPRRVYVEHGQFTQFANFLHNCDYIGHIRLHIAHDVETCQSFRALAKCIGEYCSKYRTVKLSMRVNLFTLNGNFNILNSHDFLVNNCRALEITGQHCNIPAYFKLEDNLAKTFSVLNNITVPLPAVSISFLRELSARNITINIDLDLALVKSIYSITPSILLNQLVIRGIDKHCTLASSNVFKLFHVRKLKIELADCSSMNAYYQLLPAFIAKNADTLKELDIVCLNSGKFNAFKTAKTTNFFHLFQEVRMLEKLTISCDAIDSDFCKTNSALWQRLTQFVAKVEDVPQFAISKYFPSSTRIVIEEVTVGGSRNIDNHNFSFKNLAVLMLSSFTNVLLLKFYHAHLRPSDLYLFQYFARRNPNKLVHLVLSEERWREIGTYLAPFSPRNLLVQVRYGISYGIVCVRRRMAKY